VDFELRLQNFRVLRQARWAPSGVCLLAGANGAGKTTMLDALLFLRVLFERGHEAAFANVGGSLPSVRPRSPKPNRWCSNSGSRT
jgi:predicted ATPase